MRTFPELVVLANRNRLQQKIIATFGVNFFSPGDSAKFIGRSTSGNIYIYMEDMTPSKLAGYTYELHIQLHERQIKWVSMDKTMKDEIRCVYVHMFLDMYDV